MFIHFIGVRSHLPHVALASKFLVEVGEIFPRLHYALAFRILVYLTSSALVSRFTHIFQRLLNCLVIEVVLRRFCEQKDMFITFCRSVVRTFRQAIWFIPDNVGTQIPTAFAESKSEHPRYADEVFLLDILIWFICVCIADVQPQCAVICKHSFDLVKDFYQPSDILLRRLFQAYLSALAIIAQAIIWRACHAHID